MCFGWCSALLACWTDQHPPPNLSNAIDQAPYLSTLPHQRNANAPKSHPPYPSILKPPKTENMRANNGDNNDPLLARLLTNWFVDHKRGNLIELNICCRGSLCQSLRGHFANHFGVTLPLTSGSLCQSLRGHFANHFGVTLPIVFEKQASKATLHFL